MSPVAQNPTKNPLATGPAKQSRMQATGAWARRMPLLPALIFVILLTQIPFVTTIIISFMNWNAYYPDDVGFAGLNNFIKVFTDVNARQAILVTIILTVSVVVISLLLGLGIALLLDRKFFGRGLVRTMMITPFLVVPIAAALLWKHALYNPVYGLFNGLLRLFFGENAHRDTVLRANRLLDAADVLVVLGTSLTVMSGLRFVRRSAKEGRDVIICTDGQTRGDDLATLRLHGRLAPVLSSWVRLAGGRVGR